MTKIRKPIAALFICVVMIWTQAFSCASAIQELETWSPTVLTAFSGIISIVNPPAGSVLALAGAEIPKVWALVDAAINNYKASPGTNTMSQITAALAAANTQFNGFLTAIQQNPNSQDAKAAEAGMLLLITTLQAIQAKLGPAVAPTPAAPTVTYSATARAASLGIVAAKSNRDFKSKWNQLMKSNGHPERVLR